MNTLNVHVENSLNMYTIIVRSVTREILMHTILAICSELELDANKLSFDHEKYSFKYLQLISRSTFLELFDLTVDVYKKNTFKNPSK
jgi:hypothetical protein